MSQQYYRPFSEELPPIDQVPSGGYFEIPDSGNMKLIDAGPIVPYYVIGDDGRARQMPPKLPDDFTDYIQGINDWQMDATRKAPPTYDEWKKSQDPNWEPEDDSIELPQELLDALNAAAEESGKEPPYSINITEENNPELFHKLEKMFNGPQIERPELIDPRDPSLNPDFKIPDHIFDPFSGRFYPFDDAPTYLTPKFDMDMSKAISLENDSEFMETFNRNIEGLDLDEIFPEPKGGLGALVTENPDFNPELFSKGGIPIKPNGYTKIPVKGSAENNGPQIELC